MKHRQQDLEAFMPPEAQTPVRPHRLSTAALWAFSGTATLMSAAMAGLTATMALSLDFGEAVAGGAEPWIAAATAIAEFAGVTVLCGLGLLAWHTRRFRTAGPILVTAATLLTLWLAMRFIGEYT